MKEKEFEVPQFVGRLQHEEEMRDDDRKIIDIGNGRNRRSFREQEKKVVKQKKSSKVYKIKTRAIVLLIAFGFSAGVGAKDVYDKVAPIVKVYVQNGADDANLADWFENFNVTNDGYFLENNIQGKNDGSGGAEPYDWDNPDNLTVTEEGNKVGAIVDYYNGFDGYLKASTGIGYYETVYTQMQRLVSIGKDPNSVDSLYTYEELTEILGKDKSKGMGVN